jgi:hypothetical protein
MKGMRVQAVVQELRGEKIDIIQWSHDPEQFVRNALSPAKVARVYVNAVDKAVQVIVPEDQLSLAIGKRGQNVRLAAKLTLWRIDIKSESETDADLVRQEALRRAEMAFQIPQRLAAATTPPESEPAPDAVSEAPQAATTDETSGSPTVPEPARDQHSQEAMACAEPVVAHQTLLAEDTAAAEHAEGDEKPHETHP